MIKNDKWLIENAERLGVDVENVNPSSVDCRLGGQIKVFKNRYQFEHPVDSYILSMGWEIQAPSPIGDRYDSFMKVYNLDEGDKFHLLPDCSYLAHTIETITVPHNKCALLLLKSTPARKGLTHNLACWFEAGFHGTAVMELTTSKLFTVEIGQRIPQFIYFDAEVPDKPYGTDGDSHYQNQKGAQEAWQ